jgi:hypothetical protein
MEHIKAICPYCKIKVSFSWIDMTNGGGQTTNYFNQYFENKQGAWILLECPSCNKCVLSEFKRKFYGTSSQLELKQIYPFPLPSSTDERAPLEIKKDIDEAKLCLSVNAFRACASMCRRAIQQACIKEGASKNKDLEKQIDELKEKGVITEQIRKWAHSCRYLGNDASHPENPEVTKEDAEDVLSLAEQLMNILYVMPAISEKVNKIHEKNKETKNG